MPESSSFAYDVFIAYADADKQWVTKELLPRLEKAKLTTRLFPRDSRPGVPLISDREHAIKSSRHTLMVLSAAFFANAWNEFTGALTQTLDVAARDQRVIPLLLEACDVPDRIKYLTPADFVSEDNRPYVWTQLLTALGAPPPQETPQIETPRSWYLAHPYPMPPNFTGREVERKALTHWLEGDVTHPLLVIRALGGFGKSALTWHWLTHDVNRQRWPYVVWWSFYEADATFESFVREALIYFNINPTTLGPRQQVEMLLTILYNNPILLVLDGFERELRAFSSLGAAYQGDEETSTPTPALPRSQTARTGEGAATPSPVPPASAGRGRAGEGAALRAENDRDCVSSFAEAFLRAVCARPDLRGKVLMTTRLRPRPVEQRGGILLTGCTEIELTQLQPEDAAAFFRAQGIRGNRAELENAGAPYGYHPLSLRLLAGLILTDLQQPGDIAAAQHLDVGEDLVQRQHHVLQVAYDRLSPQRQKLLGTIACFRSPVAIEALQALAQIVPPVVVQPVKPQSRGILDRLFKRSAPQSPVTSQPITSQPITSQPITDQPITNQPIDLSPALRDLIDRGWLHHDLKANRYDLHPIVRRYAYDRLASDERTAAHRQLRNYFEAVPKLDKVQRLEDLTPVIELYHHTVRAGQYDTACELYTDRLKDRLYYQLGAYQLIIELLRTLFPDGEDRPPRLKADSAQAWTLNELGNSYSLSGQPRRAVLALEQHNALRDKAGDKKNLAIGLGNVADDQLKIGELRAAEANLRRSIALCVEVGDEFKEAVGHQNLGRVLAYRGEWVKSQTELAISTAYWEKTSDAQGQCLDWAYRALRALLILRANPSPGALTRRHPLPTIGEGHGSPSPRPEERGLGGEAVGPAALTAATRALELFNEWARTQYPMERNYVRAHWMLGAAHRVNGHLAEADSHLNEALTRCRKINMVDHEANILIDLACLRLDQGERDEARRLAQEALITAERSGYALQGADANLVLARLALADGDQRAAKAYARAAKRLATCDGVSKDGNYTYKVAYDEAVVMLSDE